MPSKNEIEELINNTTKSVININNNKGMLFTSKFNKKTIFIPFSGEWYCFDNI